MEDNDRGLSEVDDILSGKTSRRAVLAGLASTAACIGPGNTGTRTGTGTDTATDTPPPSETPSPTDTATETPTPEDLENEALKTMYMNLIDPVKNLNRRRYGTIHTINMPLHIECVQRGIEKGKIEDNTIDIQNKNYPINFYKDDLDTSIVDIRNVKGVQDGDLSHYHWLDSSAEVRNNMKASTELKMEFSYGEFEIYTDTIQGENAGYIATSDNWLIQDFLRDEDAKQKENMKKRINAIRGELPAVGDKGGAFAPILNDDRINHPNTYSLRIGDHFWTDQGIAEWSDEGTSPTEEGHSVIFYQVIDPVEEVMNFYRAPITMGHGVGEAELEHQMDLYEAIDGDFYSIRLYDE